MPKVSKAALAFRKKCKEAHTKWQDLAEEYNPKMLRIGPTGAEMYWDLAIIGIGRQHGSPYVFIYDEESLVSVYASHLVLEYGVEADEAQEKASEWVSFNITDAYHGPNTPIIRVTNGQNS